MKHVSEWIHHATYLDTKSCKYGVCLLHLFGLCLTKYFSGTLKSFLVFVNAALPHFCESFFEIRGLTTSFGLTLPLPFSCTATIFWLVFYFSFARMCDSSWWRTVVNQNTSTFWCGIFALCREDRASFNCHFTWINAVTMAHYTVKIVEVRKAIFDLPDSCFPGFLLLLFK